MTEHDEQVRLLRVLSVKHPKLFIFAIPNGGSRTAREGARLKAEGVVAGVPDLFCPQLSLFIEMKTSGGRPSAAQLKVIKMLRALGYTAEVCHGCEEAVALIDKMIMEL